MARVGTKLKARAPKPSKDDVYGPSDPVEDIDDMAWLVTGRPGHGKTILALSMSQQWPKNFAPGFRSKKTIWLEDVVHVKFDRSASVGLAQFNIRVRHSVDAFKLIAKGRARNIRAANELIVEHGGNICADNEIFGAVHDTITRQAKALEEHWFRVDDSGDPRTIWRRILFDHMFYQTGTMMWDCANAYLFHLTEVPPVGSPKEAEANKIKREKLTGGQSSVKWIPEISGKAAGLYFGDASVEITAHATKNMAGKRIYKASCDELGGARSKNRLPEWLGTEEPNLRKIIDTVRRRVVSG